MDSSAETNEKTALKQNELPLPNTTKRNKEVEKWKIMGSICCVLFLLSSGLAIFTIAGWYDSVCIEREEIDNRMTTVSEKWRDYRTNEKINCTNNDPCEYKCRYIKENFHKTPPECEYEDYYNVISIIVDIWIALCICSCLFSKK